MLKLLLIIASPCFAQAPSAPAVAVSTPVATVEGLYRPVNARDPMLPSTFFGDHKPMLGGATRTGTDQGFSTSTLLGLSLTGIMSDASGRQAMLTDKSSGAVYILGGGKLLDSKRKAVPGVKGVIRGKQVELTMGSETAILNLHGK